MQKNKEPTRRKDIIDTTSNKNGPSVVRRNKYLTSAFKRLSSKEIEKGKMKATHLLRSLDIICVKKLLVLSEFLHLSTSRREYIEWKLHKREV